jgi:hypothetical protein
MKLLAKIIGSLVLFIVLILLLFFAYLNWGLQPDLPQNKKQSNTRFSEKRLYRFTLQNQSKLAQAKRYRLVGRICRRCSI